MGEKYLWCFLILYFPLSFEGLIAKNVLLPLSEAGGGEITGVPLWGVLELGFSGVVVCVGGELLVSQAGIVCLSGGDWVMVRHERECQPYTWRWRNFCFTRDGKLKYGASYTKDC